MEIISSGYLTKEFSKIDEFKNDFGLSIFVDEKLGGQDRASGGNWVVKDLTVKKYFDYFGYYPTRTGKIGSLLFYSDYSLRENEFYILDNEDLYKFIYDKTPNIREYLGGVLRMVLDKKVDPVNKVEDKQENVPDLKHMSTDELVEYLTKTGKR